MAESAARVDWAGVGVRLPRRFCTPRAVRLAVRRALSQPRLRERASGTARWAADHPARDNRKRAKTYRPCRMGCASSGATHRPPSVGFRLKLFDNRSAAG